MPPSSRFRRTALFGAVVAVLAGGAGESAGQSGSGFLSVKDFGARGDWSWADRTGADDTAAIQRALDQAARAGGGSGVVFFPAGSYRISSTLRLPNWVRLRGDNGRNSQIHADPGFSDPWMFHAANGKSSMFGSRLEDLWIRVHNNPNVRAVVKADAWQETDGLRGVVISEFTRYAVELEFGHGGAATLRFEDCELFAGTEAEDGSAGIYVHPISLVGAFVLRIDSTTIAGASSAKPLAHGILMANDVLAARAVHFENVREGVRLEARASALLEALTGSYTKTTPSALIAIAAGWSGFLSGRGLLPNGFDTTVRDEATGRRWTGTLPQLVLPERSLTNRAPE